MLLLSILLTITLSALETLRFGYDTKQFIQYNKKDTILAISLWLDELAEGSGYAIESFAYEDVELMAKDFKAKRLDFVTTSSLNFVKYFDKDDLADGFSGGDDESSQHDLMLIVKEDAPVETWYGLSDAKIYHLEGSDISKLYLDLSLLENDVVNSVRWITTKNYQQALLKLFFGQGDGAIVNRKAFDLAVEMNPQMRRRLKVFDVSTLNDTTPSYFRKGLSKTMRRDIMGTALGVSGTVRGRQLLDVFRADTIIKIPVESLHPVEEAYNSFLNKSGKQEK